MYQQDGNDQPFLRRFVLQGKMISQLIAFWWRHYDETPNTPQQKAAKYIGESLLPNFQSNPPTGGPDPRFSALIPGENDSKLIRLFSADPAKYLSENGLPDFNNSANDPSNDPILTLILVFGQERIENRRHFLSPMFDPTELTGNPEGNGLDRAFYKFIVDASLQDKGKLEDPLRSPNDPNDTYAYRYIIPLPPRPSFRSRDLDNWISDESNIFPTIPYIPFTT